MTVVQSKYNKYIKYAKKLGRRRFRDQEEKFIVEGLRTVEEIVDTGESIDFIMYTSAAVESPRGSELLRRARKNRINLVEVTEELFEEISHTENSQEISAVVNRKEPGLEDLFYKSPSLIVIIDGIQDPGNLGTIIRTSASAGVNGLVLLPGTVDLYNPKTLRSTMGNVFKQPVVRVQRDELLEKVILEKMNIVAGLPGIGKPIFDVDLTGRVAIVVGNETSGIQKDILNLASHKVYIPMFGDVDSLNVAAAAGIMLYEINRQRHK
ncbi:MAG: RNA methyltransferase [Clostridiales bacterium]|nr:RNA methyltransferase [Clostridiales bacterium]MCF8023119.1 RNA methyltransferase [Clostridiales bacterium]